jgi:hypothetical protein
VPAIIACAAMVAAGSIVHGGFGAACAADEESIDWRFEDVEVRLLVVDEGAGGSGIVKPVS